MVTEFLPILDTGGTLGFALLVYWELRTMRTELGSVLTAMVERLSVLEERTRAPE